MEEILFIVSCNNILISCDNKLISSKKCNNVMEVTKEKLHCKTVYNESTKQSKMQYYLICDKCESEIIVNENLLDRSTKIYVEKKQEKERMDNALKAITKVIDEFIAGK